MRIAGFLLLAVGLAVAAVPVAAEAAPPIPTGSREIDFTDYPGGGVTVWLAGKGMALKKDAALKDRIALSASKKGLRLEAKTQALGLVIREGMRLAESHVVEIEWAVERFPDGASWETGIRNEVLSVMVFFGEKKISSGNLFIPNTPYFLALFLGTDEKINQVYKARSYQKSGRWVCVGTPAPDTPVTSRIDLAPIFRKHFGGVSPPPISGVALSVDTSNSLGEGRAAARIQRIRFLKQPPVGSAGTAD